MSRMEIDLAKIGRYGRKLLTYRKAYNQDLYTKLLFSGGLGDCLVEQNEIGKVRIWERTAPIAKAQGVTEELIARGQMAKAKRASCGS